MYACVIDCEVCFVVDIGVCIYEEERELEWEGRGEKERGKQERESERGGRERVRREGERERNRQKHRERRGNTSYSRLGVISKLLLMKFIGIAQFPHRHSLNSCIPSC